MLKKTCRSVVLICLDKNKVPSLDKNVEVSHGTRIGDCEVSVCVPSPCYLDISTNIVISDYRKYEYVDLGDDIAVKEYRNGGENLYIYPKDVWNKILKLYLEPLRNGKPVNDHLLLIGAPGTGKTTLAHLVANYVSVRSFVLEVTDFKSKYYGESEKLLKARLDSVEQSEPAVLIVNDAEYLISSRSLTGSYASGVETTEVALRDILLDFLEKMIENRKSVLVIATTNVSPKTIDEALIRGGRFGEPIYIPLPSFTALYEYAKWLTRNESLARELAYKCMGRGLTIADLKTMIKMLDAGLNPDMRRLGGRGYARLYAEPIRELAENNTLRSLISRYFSFEKDTPTTMYMQEPFQIASPILAQLFMNLRRPALVITDPRYPDEFTFSLDTMKAVGVVPTYLTKDVQLYIRTNTSQPLVYVGEEPPAIELYTQFLTLDEIYNKLYDVSEKPVVPMIMAVARYYNIRISNEELDQASRLIRSRKYLVRNVLSALATTGTLTEDVISRIVLS